MYTNKQNSREFSSVDEHYCIPYLRGAHFVERDKR